MPVKSFSSCQALATLAHDTFSQTIKLAVALTLDNAPLPEDDSRVCAVTKAAHLLREKGTDLRDSFHSLLARVFVDGLPGATASSLLRRSEDVRDCRQRLLQAMSGMTSSIDELAGKSISRDRASQILNNAQIIRAATMAMLDATDASAFVDHDYLVKAVGRSHGGGGGVRV